MKRLLIILALISCKEKKPTISECKPKQLYSEELGCHFPDACERREKMFYPEANESLFGCVYITRNRIKEGKECLRYLAYSIYIDELICSEDLGFQNSWTYSKDYNC